MRPASLPLLSARIVGLMTTKGLMNTTLRILVPLLLPLVLGAQRPWQQITVPSVREAAGNFRTPPREYGAIHWAIWGGELTQACIVQEFDQLVASGITWSTSPPLTAWLPNTFPPNISLS